MPEKVAKAKVFKINYKALVREIRKTKKSLASIHKKVSPRQREAIALQIQSLAYLEGVCTSAAVGVAPSNVPPKMSKCNMALAKMSKIYSS